MKQEKVSKQRIEEILAVILEPDFVVYGIRVRHQEPSREIEILIDRSGGLSLKECAGIHRKFSKLTDETIIDTYQVSFSTPGIDRSCVYPQDFLLHGNREFELQLKDSRELCGRVEILDEKTEALQVLPTDSEPVNISWKDVSVARFKIAIEEIKT
ncbi:hypothetical protein HOF92_06555 [bacterium]|jgi:ribosome maturation factor RimP|nr:hypothetical protein [bacterium]